MMFRAKLVLASALLVGLTAQLQAQPPGGGRGGPGGRGGFGGGFGGGGGAGLLMMEEVRKELGVSEEQNEKIRKAMEEIGGGRGPGGFGGPGGRGGADLSEEERQKRMEELRTQMEERAKKTDAALKSVLDEKQMARLEELRIQREGAAALGRPEVAAKLKLSDEQKEKVKNALASSRPEGGFGGRGGEGSREDFQKRMEEFRAKQEKANADAVAVLTEEQKTAFAALQGEKFEFPQPNFGGRGPGGPGGRGARPPRGND